MSKLPTRKKIFDVVGEGQINFDGVSRQELLRKARPGDEAYLIREPSNRYDSNAVRVDCDAGPIGYLSREDAKLLAPVFDEGRKHTALLHEY
ncbi:MAG: HIRAN domain-containing protein, partial [Pseudomonadota bacterium]